MPKKEKKKTWTQYCLDMGSSRGIVDSWLARFFGQPKELLPPSVLPEGKYDIILADSPWKIARRMLLLSNLI